MKRVCIVLILISTNVFALWTDETNSANPSSTVSETKSLDAARRPQKTEGSYSKAGYSPYSTAAPVRLEEIIDPDAKTAISAPVSSVEDAVSQIRLKSGMSPQ